MESPNDYASSIHPGHYKLIANGKVFKTHKIHGKFWIALGDHLSPIEDALYSQELQPNGDVWLRKIEK